MHLKKRIIVTGGCGFLGSHLCDRLIERGDEVICVDNCFTGTKNNINHLLKNDNFEFVRHDVTFPLYIETNPISTPTARPKTKYENEPNYSSCAHATRYPLSCSIKVSGSHLPTNELYGRELYHLVLLEL
ncbi:MAG: GDP-mannose 4,6-dehydratase, partial [Desulfobacterales bacterium]